MTTTAPDPVCPLPTGRTDRTAWPVAGRLLDALTRRDFAGLGSCLDDHVTFRALVPPGLIELTGPDDVAARFTTWFGGEDAFEVVDASLGQVGDRIHLRWTVRMTPTGTEPARIAEQHVYARGSAQITSLDLLCSGFHHENGARS
ncbi:MAG: nuclear transport factor 2 family protein [Propionibacteriales bacterium]|nr:nuclear transport factor 2 family protein [Propionibacteriales bacterium]